MDSSDYLPLLKRLGFNTYEAQVYLSLLGEECADVARIVKKSGVPQPSVYGAVRKLMARGFAEQVMGEKKQFRAVPPTRAFANYRGETERELDKDAERMAELEKQAPKVPAVDPASWGIRLISGSENTRAEFMRLAKSCKTEICNVITPPIWSTGKPLNISHAKKSPIKRYYLVDQAMLDDPEHGESIHLLAATEPDLLRVVPRVPFKATTFDRKIVMFPLEDQDEGTTLVMPNPQLATSLALWAIDAFENAPPYEAPSHRGMAKPQTSEQE